MLERICAQAVTFIVTVVLARLLMPEEFGLIAIVNVFVAVVDILITSGFSIALIQKKEADELDFSTAFYASLVLATLLYAAVFFAAPLITGLYKNELLTPVIRVTGIKFFISSVNCVQQAYVSRQMIFRKFFFATFFGTFVSGIVGIALAFKGAGVWALVAQLLTNPFIDTIILFITVSWRPRLCFSFDRLKALFNYGWKIMCSYLAGTFFNRLSNLVVGARYSPTKLGYYNQGERLPGLVTGSITSTLESVLFPAISKYQDDREKMKASVRRSVSLGNYLLMPMLFGLAAVAPRLVPLLFGQKWELSIPYVQIFCIQGITLLLSSINLQIIKACGRSDILLGIEFIKKPVLLAVVILAARVSPLFLALCVALYAYFALFVDAFPNRRLINYSFWQQLWDVKASFFMSAIMGAAVWALGKINMPDIFVLLMQIFAGILFYLILSFLFKNKDFYYIINLLKEKFTKQQTER
ncbi:MAG: lipopolysaccharide biosynthesis protein [Treponema sp.]|nr:lipopolysaccharide biosynthesis protein [Treponema sp.]